MSETFVYMKFIKIAFRLTKDYLVIIWGYQFYIWTFSYLVMGMCGLCIILEIKNGFVAVLSACFYPSYVIMVLTVWCFLGSHFEEIVSIDFRAADTEEYKINMSYS